MGHTIKSDFEKICSDVISGSIIGVNYVNISGMTDFNLFSDSSFDSVDFGVELEMIDGSLLSISWGTEFVQYGISLRKYRLNEVFNNVSTLDVGRRSRWSTLLSVPIRHISIYWHVLISNGISKEYPQDLEIAFDSNKTVWIGARVYIPKEDALLPFSDEITIIFDDEIAQKYHMGKYSQHNDKLTH